MRNACKAAVLVVFWVFFFFTKYKTLPLGIVCFEFCDCLCLLLNGNTLVFGIFKSHMLGFYH